MPRIVPRCRQDVGRGLQPSCQKFVQERSSKLVSTTKRVVSPSLQRGAFEDRLANSQSMLDLPVDDLNAVYSLRVLLQRCTSSIVMGTILLPR